MSVFTNMSENNTKQALRRQKYLHTSLTQRSSRQDGRTKKLCVNKLKDASCNSTSASTKKKLSTKQKCDLSLAPENGLKKKPRSATRNELKKKNAKSGLYQKRAPLVSPTAYFNPQYTPYVLNSVTKAREGNYLTENRVLKSAPVHVTSTLDPDQYGCNQCFVNEFEALHKQNSRKYYTNIRIGRVCFSARPAVSQRTSVNSTPACRPMKTCDTRRQIPLPTKCFYAGWGLRKPRETRNKALELSLESTLEVTAGLRTLKLHSNGKTTENMSPPPPPTPIQQIDIKLPEGKVIKNRLV